MQQEKIINILKEHISQMLDKQGNLIDVPHIHFDELFENKSFFDDWNKDFCFEVFNYIANQYEKWKPKNRVFLELVIPLRDSDQMVIDVPDLANLVPSLHFYTPPFIQVIPYDFSVQIIDYKEEFNKVLNIFDYPFTQKIAWYACCLSNEPHEGYARYIYFRYYPQGLN